MIKFLLFVVEALEVVAIHTLDAAASVRRLWGPRCALVLLTLVIGLLLILIA